MLVRATAIATDRSNAIGTVELQCTPHGLVIVYLGVGAFSEGYAPGALTMGTRVTVPWSEVYEARVEGDQLFLSLEPARTPHHLLTLVNFSTGDSTHPKEDTRQRLMIWISAVAYRPHRNRGIWNQPISFGRSLWIVTMKFRPVKMELNPRMNAPNVAGMTAVFVVVL